MARIVIEVKDKTKAKLYANAVKAKKNAKDYILWSTGLIALEKGIEK